MSLTLSQENVNMATDIQPHIGIIERTGAVDCGWVTESKVKRWTTNQCKFNLTCRVCNLHVSMYPSGWTPPLCPQARSMGTALLHGNDIKKSHSNVPVAKKWEKDLCNLSKATDWLDVIGVNSIKTGSLLEELMRYLNLPVFFRWYHKAF